MDPLKLNYIGTTGIAVTTVGLGGGPIGQNPAVTDNISKNIIQTAFNSGIRYLDTAPYYGSGLSELRYSEALSEPCPDYVISTKVGRLLKGTSEINFKTMKPNNLPYLDNVYDFSKDGIIKSFEQSMERLKLSTVDILYFHDVQREFYQQSIDSGILGLMELKSQGVKAIGVGVRDVKLLTEYAQTGVFDCLLVPGLYTLLDQSALPEVFTECESRGISIIIGGPYDAGFITGSLKIAPELQPKLDAINSVCTSYDVPLKAAAMQFPAAHSLVASVLTGPKSVRELQENMDMMSHPIKNEFWDALRSENLISLDAPVPLKTDTE